MAEEITEVPAPETPAAQPKAEELSFAPENFAADIAKLAAETGQPNPLVKEETPPEPEVSPTTPAQPEQAAATPEATKPEVPEKFKKPDGTIDTEKLNKSTISADEALAKYLEKEKELKRKMNEVKQQENAYLKPPVAPAPANQPEPINPDFAAQLEADLAKDGAGKVLAKLFIAAQQSVEERVQNEISSLKAVNEETRSRQQIEAIGKADPWVYTPEGVSTLTKILDEQPYMWGAKEPYKAAYIYHTGLKNVVSKSGPQVMTPTPPARPTAPVPSGQAANQTPQPTVKLDTREAIEQHLNKLTPKQQSEFFERMGYPAF